MTITATTIAPHTTIRHGDTVDGAAAPLRRPASLGESVGVATLTRTHLAAPGSVFTCRRHTYPSHFGIIHRPTDKLRVPRPSR